MSLSRTTLRRKQAHKAMLVSKSLDGFRPMPQGGSTVTVGAYRRSFSGAGPRARPRNIGRGRKSLGVEVGFTPGQLTKDPRLAIAYMIRGALRSHPVPPAIIYDASGKAVAKMDAATRERTAL